MKKIHKSNNNMAYSEVDSTMLSVSFTTGDEEMEEFDASDISDKEWEELKKDKKKAKRYATKKRKIMLK
jgi:predicted DNA binding CopG/RHH family protein